MNQLIFHVLFWMFSAGFYICGNAQQMMLQTFLKPHAREVVIETAQPRLKDIDVSNPLFVLR